MSKATQQKDAALTEASGILSFILDHGLVHDQFLIGRMSACITNSKIALQDDGWFPIVEDGEKPDENYIVIVWCQDSTFGPAKLKDGKWIAVDRAGQEVELEDNAIFWRHPFQFGPPRSVTEKVVN